MESFLEFRTEHYNALSPFDDAQRQAGRFQPVVDEVGRLIIEHGIDDLIGVALLHKHFDLRQDERIVWGESATQDREGVPRVVSNAELVPCVWQWSGDDHRLRPLEYEDPSIAPEAADAAAALVTKPEFVEQVGATLQRGDAARWIGLARLPAASTHSVQREENDSTLRQSTRTWVPHTELEVHEDTVTLWSFGAKDTVAAMVCGACKHERPPIDVRSADASLLGKRASMVCVMCKHQPPPPPTLHGSADAGALGKRARTVCGACK